MVRSKGACGGDGCGGDGRLSSSSSSPMEGSQRPKPCAQRKRVRMKTARRRKIWRKQRAIRVPRARPSNRLRGRKMIILMGGEIGGKGGGEGMEGGEGSGG